MLTQGFRTIFGPMLVAYARPQRMPSSLQRNNGLKTLCVCWCYATGKLDGAVLLAGQEVAHAAAERDSERGGFRLPVLSDYIHQLL